jgi:tetratricopeptide (TPR) repeat protein
MKPSPAPALRRCAGTWHTAGLGAPTVDSLAAAPRSAAAALWPRRALTLAIVAAVTGAALAVAGPAAAALTFSSVGLALQLVRLLLPRWAHAAFVRGHLTAAARRYRALSALAWRRPRHVQAELSRAAVALAQGELERGEAMLESLDGDAMDLSTRAAWLNNRAYVRLRRGDRLDEASALAAAALELRPDVAAIRHTHSLALLARGQLDAAIAALDELHRLAELPPALEAERCADLARAWSQKGEDAYAAEYRGRAALARQRG